MNINSKYDRVLTAASDIVKERGVEKLTLEAVAKEAGVSKGGLLYHFPNKEALLEGLVQYLTSDFASDVQQRVDNATADNGKWSRAYIEQTIEDIKEERGISAALIVALFANPDLLSNLQEQYAVWQKNFENDGMDPVNSTIVRLVADGIWFSEVFGLGKLDVELREKVVRKLINMTK
ncbi:TetR/AcrR family transcriptional regulator [Paenibacillus allorhizosphaerae]|uniref:HTH-type transcriptional regulator MtrR n=1 Tax=Paenibacillus allorhizosphaerae TaxID=2849866 RepID=A0ABM8VAA5_9BACL|nr:TetR/AcrR family transcriptional regulator [Paenibacillus allorhizosphaerae]CAG7615818.1 HTH-type transcriptional regulator MtrR [Paenibacillus allorhizosphaerae]